MKFKECPEEEDYLTEMSNLTPEDSGLKNNIWILSKNNKTIYGPRIMVKIDNDLIPICISDKPGIVIDTFISIPNFTDIQSWIVLNKDLLLKYWNSEGSMSMRDVLDNLIKHN
jgi:hypothetical protein